MKTIKIQGCVKALKMANTELKISPESQVTKIIRLKSHRTIGFILKQVFINIIRNAWEAVSAEDIIKLKVDYSHTDKVCINVHNGDEPIPLQVITKVFQPFFSTKPCSTGLGLAITKRIVNAHNGELLISSDLLTGTTVSVQLPVVIK